MQVLTNALLRTFRLLFAVKQRLFPHLRLERIIRVIPGLDSIQRKLVVRSKVDFVEDVLGHKMYLDDKDSLQLSIKRIHEPFETQFVVDQIKPGDVVLDIGANIGYYTLQFCRKVGPAGEVYAFEPDPENCNLIRKNLAVNGYANAKVVEAAVCDVMGTVKLYHNPEQNADHRIFDAGDKRHSFDVPAIQMDSYLSKLSRPINFIKMDIQGAEYRAILGMRELLLKNPQAVLVTEFEPHSLIKSGADPETYLRLLSSLGFELLEIDEGLEGTKAVTCEYLLKKYKNRDGYFTNLLCRRPTL